jgi:hypothetical protein
MAWKYKKEFSAFHKKHGGKFFTPTWNDSLEKEMQDETLEPEWRAWSGIRRFSWGNLSDWAVDGMPAQDPKDPKPRPMTQEKLGSILGLSPATMSRACSFLRDGGYLKKDHLYLCPQDSVPLESTETQQCDFNSRQLPFAFSSYKKDLLLRETETAKRLAEFEAARKSAADEIRKVNYDILKRYRAWLWEQQKSNPSVINNEQEASAIPVDPLRSFANAQDETRETGETKPNSTCSYTTQQHFNSNGNTFHTPPIPENGVETEKPATPNVSNSDFERPLKLKSHKGKSMREETTTTVVNMETSSSSPSPIQSLPIPCEFADRLPRGFAEAGKPTPTRAQIAAAYVQVGPRWEEFLDWIPNADEFRRLAHPGGLRTLIGFFLATEPGQEPQKRPVDRQDAKREELLRGMRAIDRMKGRVG